MLCIVRQLFETLDYHQVRFCHWKSNATLESALDGEGDLDVLVDPRDGPTVETVMTELGFVEATFPAWRSRPGAHHFYAFDQNTSTMVHVDLYEQLLTGGTLLKNHHLPVESLLLSDLHRQSSVPVPTRGAELAMLVIRKMLECASLPEHLLFLREYRHILSELKWLTDSPASHAEAVRFVQCAFPMLDPQLFDCCLQVLFRPHAVLARYRLGQELSRTLASHALMPRLRAEQQRWLRLARWLLRRLRIGPDGSSRLRRGRIVAFVGPEGSGKSTQVRETTEWLGQAFGVRAIHVGKPPASLVSAIPNLLAPTMRRLLPGYRPTVIAQENAYSKRCGAPGLYLYMCRCLSLGVDRWLLLRRAARDRDRGLIVVCDRYPSLQHGFVDSPQLDVSQPGWFAACLAHAEHSLYRSMPHPDLVITCQVSLDEALHRNTTRPKKGGAEPEALVRHRHAEFAASTPADFQQYVLDTTRPAHQTRLTVRQLVWQTLTNSTRWN